MDYNRDSTLTQYDLLALIASAENHVETGTKGSIPAKLTVTSSTESVKAGSTFTLTLELDADGKEVNTYFIKATYPKNIATLAKADAPKARVNTKPSTTPMTARFFF